MLPIFTAIAVLQTNAAKPEIDPYALPIGPAGKVKIEPGQLIETRTGKVVTLPEVAKAAKGKRFLFVGENHATTLHQQMEADVVKALADSGLKPSVGVEFFHRTKQDILDLWSLGTMSESDFLTQVDWKTQWGYGYDFYRPLFEVIKARKMPLVGLNVPRDWVRKVGKSGYESLPMSARIQLPETVDLNNTNHKQVFNALMGGHDMGPNSANIYSAQVLWDEGMADTAAKYLQIKKPTSQDIFVVIAGSGHIMYGQGINYRLNKRKAGTGINLVMIQSDKPTEISKGLGDFVYCTKPESKPK
jgi:aminopeptidase N